MIIPGYSINPEKMPRWPLIRRGGRGRRIIGIVEKKEKKAAARSEISKARDRSEMLRVITLAVLKGSIAVKHRPIKGEEREAEVKLAIEMMNGRKALGFVIATSKILSISFIYIKARGENRSNSLGTRRCSLPGGRHDSQRRVEWNK